MGNILKKLGFNKEMGIVYDDYLNADCTGYDPNIVPYGEKMVYAYNGTLYECRIIAALYNLKYNGTSYNYAVLIERPKEDGTTCHTIVGGRESIFKSVDDYIGFKSAMSENERNSYLPSFVQYSNMIQIGVFLRNDLYDNLEIVKEGYKTVSRLWEWDESRHSAVSVKPKFDLIWCDEDGFHLDDSKGYLSNTDKYFKSKAECVEAHYPKLIKFGEVAKAEEPKEYVVEVAVKVKAKSYEEAVSICNGAKINIVAQ